jgi:signal transduction histidine kinase
LGTILGRARQLLAHEADPERVRLLSTIGGQAVRARDMIGDAMVFARPPAPELSSVELPDVVSDVTGLLAGLLDAAAVQIEVQCHPPIPPIRADRVQAAIVVSELLRNAVAASQPGDTITLRIEPLQLDGRSVLQLTCGNRGDQLTETDLRHLFDPFYSGRSAGRGLGFGLAKCWRIVRLHEGCIHADLVAGELIVRVHWPAASHSIAPPSDAIDTGSR